MLEIHLTGSEVLLGAMCGLQRHMEALRKGLPDRHGYEGDGWGVHIEGACGELAFAKAAGLYWNGSVNTFKVGGDVSGIEVRTRSRHDYELLIRPNDHDDAAYVLVTGKVPDFRVHGWLSGREAKQHSEWLQRHGNRPGAYFVPHDALHGLAELTHCMVGV